MSSSSSLGGDLPLLGIGDLDRFLGSGVNPGGGSIGVGGSDGDDFGTGGLLECVLEFLRMDFITPERVSPPSLVDVESVGNAGGATLGC